MLLDLAALLAAKCWDSLLLESSLVRFVLDVGLNCSPQLRLLLLANLAVPQLLLLLVHHWANLLF
jgi:hypothetical protein